MSDPAVMEAHRAVQEELILLPSWDADRVRDFLGDAVAQGNAEAVRKEGHTWSGRIALSLFHLADAIDQSTDRTTEK